MRPGYRVPWKAALATSLTPRFHRRSSAGSDVAMTDQQLTDARASLFHIPMVMGAVVPTYNAVAAARVPRCGVLEARVNSA